MPKVTIKDVARAAGVSISTVSKALNGSDVVHPDTREHVLKVAEKLNYIPNLNGKVLKSGETNVLGLFVTSIAGPYYNVLAESIYKECQSNGYELNIFISKNPKTIMNNILGKRVDGAIILNEFISDKEIELLEKAKIPAVFLDREKVSRKISSVVFDSYKAGQIVTRYLINQGHKKIGYIRGYQELYDDIQRYKGFRDTLEEYGLEFDEDYLLTGFFEEEASFNAVKSFLRSGKELPDAFLAANDLSAFGCIKALRSEDINVPNDISIVGFDDIELSEYFNPPLTTVKNPIKKQGKEAINQLLQMIKHDGQGKLIKLEGRLVIRNSSTLNKKIIN